MRKRLQAVLNRINELAGMAERSETQNSELDTLVAEAEDLQAKIATEDARSQKIQGLNDFAGQSQREPVHGEPQPQGAGQPVFGSLGEQIAAVIRADAGSTIDPRLTQISNASGMNESISSDGGFLVEPTFVRSLIEPLHETGILASRCDSLPLGRTSNGVKLPAIDETSRADGSRSGGVRAYWAAEAKTATATKPKFRLMELSLKKLMAFCYLTDELISDTTALEAWVKKQFSAEMGFALDNGIVNGTGAGQPLGFMNADCLVTVAKEADQTADTLVKENIFKMYSRLPARSLPRSAWLINQDVWPQIFGLNTAAAGTGQPLFMGAGTIKDAPFGSLLGRPIIPIEHAATLGDKGDIVLADLDQYQLIDKGGMNAASSVHVRFLYDEQCLRFVYRTDGQPKWASALTPYKGSATQSPFVTLAARA